MKFSEWQQNEPLSDINVTPFVDVLLVLLIIFMITAPVMNQVIQVELPQDQYAEEGDSQDKTLRISINKEGLIYVNEIEIGTRLENEALIQFIQELKKWKKNKSEPWFADVEADRSVQYGAIIPVIARLKEEGIDLSLVIEPTL